MTRSSPNKRKSLAADTPGSATPKKGKMESETQKTPKRKSMKLENGMGTPAMGKMANGKSPKTPKTKTPAKPAVAKTPKSAKKGNKQVNTPKLPVPESPEISSDENMETANEQVVPKTLKSGKKHVKPVPSTPTSNEGASGSPKSKKKGNKTLRSAVPGVKDANTKKIQDARNVLTPDVAKILSRNQRRRLSKKLKKLREVGDKKAVKTESVAQKSIAEIAENQSPSDKPSRRKNKKNKSMLNRSLEGAVTEVKAEITKGGKKMRKAKGANTVT